MSKYVDEIIKDIKANPDTWVDYLGQGIKKDNVVISQFGNTRLISIVKVEINKKQMPATYIDCYKLEAAIGWWYKTVSIKTLMK